MPERNSDAPADQVIFGGSLHRDPDGRLCTIQTVRAHIDPQTVQGLWSRVSRQRYPSVWEGQPARGALVIYWTEPIKVTCGGCSRSLGSYRAYEAGPEKGLVEDTSVEYVRDDYPIQPGDHTRRRIGSARPFRIDGEIAGRAARTEVLFHCRKCDRTYRQNLQTLASELLRDRATAFRLLPGVHG